MLLRIAGSVERFVELLGVVSAPGGKRLTLYSAHNLVPSLDAILDAVLDSDLKDTGAQESRDEASDRWTPGARSEQPARPIWRRERPWSARGWTSAGSKGRERRPNRLRSTRSRSLVALVDQWCFRRSSERQSGQQSRYQCRPPTSCWPPLRACQRASREWVGTRCQP